MATEEQCENVIKACIKKHHLNKSYNDENLSDIITGIKTEIQSQCEFDDIKLSIMIMQYLYYQSKDGTFYFNSNKKQAKLREYHTKIIKKINKEDPNIFVDTQEVLPKDIEVENKPSITPDENKPLIDNVDTPPIVNVDVIPITNIDSTLYTGMVYNPNNLSSNPPHHNPKRYTLPVEPENKLVKRIQYEYEPFGTQWVHDIQQDDIIDSVVQRNIDQFDILRAVVLPPQKSQGWYDARDKCITASDMAQALGFSKYNPQYEFILKKTTDKIPFIDNRFVHHGKKYEDVANLIYDYRMNVHTEAFGLLPHPKYPFLAASPDAICSKYKHDKIHKSQYVGTMVEIKCVVSRKILTYHDLVEEHGTTDISYDMIVDKICPLIYFQQIQMQLETCDLEHCHFWQCELHEYENFNEFVKDTDSNETFRSRTTKFEKGALIQLLPKNWRMDVLLKRYNNELPPKEQLEDVTDVEYEASVISWAQYIYPPKVEMSPHDCQNWITLQLEELKTNSNYKDYVFDKVVYWKIVKTSCILVTRDREWFSKNLPDMTRVWSYVVFLRGNQNILDLFCDFIDTRTTKINKTIMRTLDRLCNPSAPDYNTFVEDLRKEIDLKKKAMNSKLMVNTYEDSNMDDYAFVDEKEEVVAPKKKIKKASSIPKPLNAVPDDFMFVDDAPVTVKPVVKKPVVKKPIATKPVVTGYANKPFVPKKKVVDDDMSDYMFV
jgi:putative phage-type endonuclease